MIRCTNDFLRIPKPCGKSQGLRVDAIHDLRGKRAMIPRRSIEVLVGLDKKVEFITCVNKTLQRGPRARSVGRLERMLRVLVRRRRHYH